MNRLVVASAITIAGALLEGALAGGGIRARLLEVRRRTHRCSPCGARSDFWYYATCFGVAHRLVSLGIRSSSSRVALALLVALVIGNALWNYAFFRRRDWRLTWRIAAGCAVLAVGLMGALAVADRMAALIFLPYLIYLAYGTWWTWALVGLNT